MSNMKSTASWAEDATGWLLRLLLHDGGQGYVACELTILIVVQMQYVGDVFGVLESRAKGEDGRCFEGFEGMTRSSR